MASKTVTRSIDFSFAPFAANLPAETVEPVRVVKNNGILGDQGLILKAN